MSSGKWFVSHEVQNSCNLYSFEQRLLQLNHTSSLCRGMINMPRFLLTLCWAHRPGKLCEYWEGTETCADTTEAGDRWWCWGLCGGCDGTVQLSVASLERRKKEALVEVLNSTQPGVHPALLPSPHPLYLSAGVWVVDVSRFLPSLIQAIVLAVVPLYHRRILGWLGAIGYIELHYHNTRPCWRHT